jgi:hypothetical protein
MKNTCKAIWLIALFLPVAVWAQGRVYIADYDPNETIKAWVGTQTDPGSGYLLNTNESQSAAIWYSFTIDVRNWGGLAPINDQIMRATMIGGDEGTNISDILLGVARVGNPILELYFLSYDTNAFPSLPSGLPNVTPTDLTPINELPSFQEMLGYNWSINSGAFTSPGGVTDNIMFNVSSVPEPGTMALTGSGLATLLLIKRLRQRK